MVILVNDMGILDTSVPFLTGADGYQSRSVDFFVALPSKPFGKTDGKSAKATNTIHGDGPE